MAALAQENDTHSRQSAASAPRARHPLERDEGGEAHCATFGRHEDCSWMHFTRLNLGKFKPAARCNLCERPIGRTQPAKHLLPHLANDCPDMPVLLKRKMEAEDERRQEAQLQQRSVRRRLNHQRCQNVNTNRVPSRRSAAPFMTVVSNEEDTRTPTQPGNPDAIFQAEFELAFARVYMCALPFPHRG